MDKKDIKNGYVPHPEYLVDEAATFPKNSHLNYWSEALEEIKKPTGDFIIENAKGIQLEDGMYYHYSEVIKILKKYKNE